MFIMYDCTCMFTRKFMYFDRYWLLKFGIIIGMCVGAFYIPRDYEFGLGIFSY